jgi:hypothetical protein
VQGDERLFGLAAALKSKGLKVEVRQDEDESPRETTAEQEKRRAGDVE